MRKFTEQSIRNMWSKLLTSKAKELYSLFSGFPGARSLLIRYEEIDALDREFAIAFAERPDEYVRVLRSVFESGFLPPEFREDRAGRFNIRFSSSFPDMEKRIGNVRSDDINRFLVLEGVVKRVTEVTPTLTLAAFQCGFCLATNLYAQSGPRVREPEACPSCGRGRKDGVDFRLRLDMSVFRDTQLVELQERPELLRGSAQPARINVHLDDDLCGRLNPGDRVRVSGILRASQRMPGGAPGTQFDLYFEASYLEKESAEYEEVQVSEQEEELIRKVSSSPGLYSLLARSIAPTIYGLAHVKEAMVLQLFGGVRKQFSDGTGVRGDIHILLLGDPGTAKSQLLRYAVGVAPKSVYSSGKGSSAAGLTAAAVKDGFTEGRWTLEAGTLVLADGGLAAIDELDKIDREDRSAMHEAMEQQTVTVAKAGINATLVSRCSVLAAANPKLGRLQDGVPFVEQTDLPPSLISRFDLIFLLRDAPGRGDEDMANYIIDVHAQGEMAASGSPPPSPSYVPELPQEFLRKYVVYARRKCFPVLSPEAREKIKEYYLEKRRMSMETKTMVITPRQLEALIRLSEASARVRLSPRITPEDVERATRLMDYFLSDVASVNGTVDIDIVSTGHSSRERSEIAVVMDIVKRYEEQFGYAKLSDMENEASKEGIDPERLARLLKVMKNSAMVYEFRSDCYRVFKPPP